MATRERPTHCEASGCEHLEKDPMLCAACQAVIQSTAPQPDPKATGRTKRKGKA